MLLLDEIEKAHPDVYNILLQVMDHATLTDNNGRKADFRHVILIMTTNAGGRELATKPMGFGDRSRLTAEAASKPAVERLFTPEFRNRIDAWVVFKALEMDSVKRLIVDKLVVRTRRPARRARHRHRTDRWRPRLAGRDTATSRTSAPARCGA